MKILSFALFINLTLCLTAFSKYSVEPLEKRFAKSNLILLGYLDSFQTRTNGEVEVSEGFITVTEHITGELKPIKNPPFIKISWKNSKNFACSYSPPTKQIGFWLLKNAPDGRIKELSPGAFVALDEIEKIEALLGFKIENKNNFFFKQRVDRETSPKYENKTVCVSNKKTNIENMPGGLIRALLVFILALIIYQLIYRTRFKIKVKRKKKNG